MTCIQAIWRVHGIVFGKSVETINTNNATFEAAIEHIYNMLIHAYVSTLKQDLHFANRKKGSIHPCLQTPFEIYIMRSLMNQTESIYL